jgi:hypothetical protein
MGEHGNVFNRDMAAKAFNTFFVKLQNKIDNLHPSAPAIEVGSGGEIKGMSSCRPLKINKAEITTTVIGIRRSTHWPKRSIRLWLN